MESYERLHIPISVLAGIIMCCIVYKLTGLVSRQYFKGYSKLSESRKVEWNNRGFSTFHALFVVSASSRLLLQPGLFYTNSQHGFIVDRTSFAADVILGMSVGYFISDLAMILWHFPLLGGVEYLLHHGIALFAILVSLVKGELQFYAFIVLSSEATTPFVNLRWHLDISGLKGTSLYIINGVALFLGWLIARILLFTWLFIHMYTHYDQVKGVSRIVFYTILATSPIIASMNVYWFWKITKGVIRTLFKAKHIH